MASPGSSGSVQGELAQAPGDEGRGSSPVPPGGQPRFWEGPAAVGASGAAGWGLASPITPEEGCILPVVHIRAAFVPENLQHCQCC